MNLRGEIGNQKVLTYKKCSVISVLLFEQTSFFSEHNSMTLTSTKRIYIFYKSNYLSSVKRKSLRFVTNQIQIVEQMTDSKSTAHHLLGKKMKDLSLTCCTYTMELFGTPVKRGCLLRGQCGMPSEPSCRTAALILQPL